jgi:hypothetical protein
LEVDSWKFLVSSQGVGNAYECNFAPSQLSDDYFRKGTQMIDIKAETLLTFHAAANSLPTKPHISTIHRWRLRGIRGVKLDSVLVGGVRYTSDEALQRFFECTTAVADGREAAPTRTSAQRKKAIEAAERELQEAGI